MLRTHRVQCNPTVYRDHVEVCFMLRSMAAIGRLTIVTIAGVFTLGAQQQQPAGAAAASSQRVLVNKYCVTCHNEKLKTGGLVLENVNVESVGQNPDVWEKVL